VPLSNAGPTSTFSKTNLLMIERFDMQGNRWIRVDGHDFWHPDQADTDMGGLDGDELERFCGPLYESGAEWVAAFGEAASLSRRWFAQDSRHRLGLVRTVL